MKAEKPNRIPFEKRSSNPKTNFNKDGTCKYGCHVCPACNESLRQQALSELRKEIKKNVEEFGEFPNSHTTRYFKGLRLEKVLELIDQKGKGKVKA